MNSYRGWAIYNNPSAPVTGRWRAVRYGVGMCAGDEASLKRMIDAKLHDEQTERDKRAAR